VLPARHLSYRIDDLRLDATYLVQVASAALGDTSIVTVSGILINSWFVETRIVEIRVSLSVCWRAYLRTRCPNFTNVFLQGDDGRRKLRRALQRLAH